MSLHPHPIPAIPDETARVAKAALPQGALCLRLRDELGVIFADEDFVDLYPAVGQPAAAPWRLTLVIILQSLEDLSDRQAAHAVRSRIDWKYLLGLDLTDAGFDWSILSEFRARLVAGHAEMRLLETVLVACEQRGWLKARGRQRTDSTHVLTAARALNRLELVVETLRAALNVLATAAPDWLAGKVPGDWFDRYAQRADDYHFPKSKEARAALGEQIGRDGYQVLAWIAGVDDAPLRETVAALTALATLRAVWEQQFIHEGEGVRWRTGAELAPSGERIDTPYDPDARYSTKRSTTWTGYKVHLTETCDEETPHLITDVTTTLATVPDVMETGPIEKALVVRKLPPSQHIVDSGYVSAEELVKSRQCAIDLVGPIRADGAWQAQGNHDNHAYALAAFEIQWEQQQARCPQGKVSRQWKPTHTPVGKPTIHVEFDPADCTPCPVRMQCTHAKRDPRELTLRPQAQDEAMRQLRLRQRTPAFKDLYAQRAGIEGTLSQGLRLTGLRHARYRGFAKVHLQHSIAAVALNLVRIDTWLAGVPLAHTRTSPFARLKSAA